MIQGATMRLASAIRTTIEATTIPVSHTQAGTASARARTPARGGASATARLRVAMSPDEPCFSRPRRQLVDVVDADLGGRLGDPPEHRVGDRLSARGLLERARVRVRDATEVVLSADVRARRRSQLVLALRGQLERGRDRADLVPVDRDAQRDA